MRSMDFSGLGSSWARRVAALAALAGVLACGGDDGPKRVPVVIGSTSVVIDTRREVVRVNESGIGNLIADVLRDGLRDAGYEVDIAFMNGGGIRGGEDRGGAIHPPGELTDVIVEGWLPFDADNEIVTLTGTQLKSIMERASRSLPVDFTSEEDRSGWFLHPSGLRYEITCANERQVLNLEGSTIEAPGDRITMLEVEIDGAPTVVYDVDAGIDLLAETSIVAGASTFLTGGSDGHLAFAEPGPTDREIVSKEETFDLSATLKDYIEANSPIAPATDGRITIIGGCGSAL